MTIEFKATVTEVVDSRLPTGVTVGSVIKGSYTYNLRAVDTNPLAGVGDYEHTTRPYGITVNLGPFKARTDPSNPYFLVEIVDNVSDDDNYLLRSYNNVSTGPPVDHIAWQLDDFTQTANDSAALPKKPPVLSRWEQVFGLTVEGPRGPGGPTYFIRATVTSVSKA